jgi:hypothetical protein
MADEREAVFWHTLVRQLVEEDKQERLDVDEALELPQVSQILHKAVEIEFYLVRSV